MAITAGLVLGAMAYLETQATPVGQVGAVVAAWCVAYLLGKFCGQAQGFNDDVAQSSTKSTCGMSEEDAGGAVGFGCLLAVFQFAFGGLYTGINALLGLSGTSRARLNLATALVTLLFNQPGEDFSLERISRSLQEAGLPTAPKPLQKTLRMLITKNYVHGTPEAGYGCNPSQTAQFI